jgi:hypothetical protein
LSTAFLASWRKSVKELFQSAGTGNPALPGPGICVYSSWFSPAMIRQR